MSDSKPSHTTRRFRMLLRLLPAEFRGLADENAAWDERAIVDALRRQARHQESTRWDTLEFKLD